MRVVFDARAIEDLEHIFRFIVRDNPSNARSVIDRILTSIARLGTFPGMGRLGQVEGTREWVIPRLPYVAVYRVIAERDELVVTGIFHVAQDRAR